MCDQGRLVWSMMQITGDRAANGRASAKSLRQEWAYVPGTTRRSVWLTQSKQREEWSKMRSGGRQG